MNETRKQIADIIADIDLDRKIRITRQQKAAFEELKDVVGGIYNKLAKLNLRLWHMEYKCDYHSLTLGEAAAILNDIRLNIETVLEKLPSSEQ